LKIVDRLVTAFVQKILEEMKELSVDLQNVESDNPIQDAREKLKAKEALKKLHSRQALLMLLRVF